MKTRHFVILGAALLLATPAITTLPGCSGGGNVLNGNNQIINDLPITFGNGQTGQLDLTIANRALNAVLQVGPMPGGQVQGQRVSTQAISFVIPPDIYQGSGTINSAGEFSLTFDLPAPLDNLTVTGVIPTLNRQGSYTLQIANQTQSGTFPALGQGAPTPTGTVTGTPTATATGAPTPTATVRPTPTAVASGGSFGGGLSAAQNSNVSSFDFTLPLKFSTARDTAPRLFSASFESRSGSLWKSMTFEVLPTANLAAGQTFTLGANTSAASLNYFEASNSNPSGTAKNWDSTGGTLRIDSIQGDVIRFTIIGAQMQPRSGSNSTGTFTLSGNGQALRSFGN